MVGDHTQIGMMAKNTKVMNHCLESSIWENEKADKLTNCTAVMDTERLYKEIQDNCHDKEQCTVNI